MHTKIDDKNIYYHITGHDRFTVAVGTGSFTVFDACEYTNPSGYANFRPDVQRDNDDRWNSDSINATSFCGQHIIGINNAKDYRDSGHGIYGSHPHNVGSYVRYATGPLGVHSALRVDKQLNSSQLQKRDRGRVSVRSRDLGGVRSGWVPINST
jgi:hypothetical protein